MKRTLRTPKKGRQRRRPPWPWARLMKTLLISLADCAVISKGWSGGAGPSALGSCPGQHETRKRREAEERPDPPRQPGPNRALRTARIEAANAAGHSKTYLAAQDHRPGPPPARPARQAQGGRRRGAHHPRECLPSPARAWHRVPRPRRSVLGGTRPAGDRTACERTPRRPR